MPVPPSGSGRLLFGTLGQTEVVSTDPEHRGYMRMATWPFGFIRTVG